VRQRTPLRQPAELQRQALTKAALAVGAVFLLVGILGFIPGITTGYDTMSFASHHSEALLLGIFNVSILHKSSTCCSASPGSRWLAPFRARGPT
jgi:hypothetical protein